MRQCAPATGHRGTAATVALGGAVRATAGADRAGGLPPPRQVQSLTSALLPLRIGRVLQVESATAVDEILADTVVGDLALVSVAFGAPTPRTRSPHPRGSHRTHHHRRHIYGATM